MQVVVERPGELIPRSFWLLTSIPSLYRRRGKAEGHLGELMSVVAPALSSTSRRKSHYRGKEIAKRAKGMSPFACNQVRLLLAGFGYQIMHVQRAVLERMTGTGWSLRRLAERVLCTPARFTVSGPSDHDDHRRRVGTLAHARPRARDPARALRIEPAATPHRPLLRPWRPTRRGGVPMCRRLVRRGRKTPPFRPANLGKPPQRHLTDALLAELGAQQRA